MRNITFILLFLLVLLAGFWQFSAGAMAQMAITPSPSPSVSPSPSATPVPTPVPTPRPDLTQESEETLGPLEELLESQELRVAWPANPLKFAIRNAVEAGVPANTIVLMLLLPLTASVIAASRHLLGLRGFGIFLPAALSVVFVATGPLIGIGLFLLIVVVSTTARMIMRKLKLKLQYLPRMALILWAVSVSVLGLLFLTPVIGLPDLSNVSIFPVLVLALLAEDFTRVQLGKSFDTAINITTETLIMALVSYIFLTLSAVQQFALLNPELLLLGILVFNFILGKYSGLRFLEYWRFRKLITG